MLDGLYDWARQIIVFLLVTELLFRLTGEKYRKYLRLTVGLCLVFLIASPILTRLAKTDLAGLFRGADLKAGLAFEEASGDVSWRDGVLAEYETLAKKQISEVLSGLELSVTRVQFWITEDVIDGMTVWVEEERKKEESDAGKAPVSITEIVIALERRETEISGEEAAAVFVAQMRIADFYDMDISHINVIKEE